MEDILQGQKDICDLLEVSARQSARLAQENEALKLASSPRAHACIQGIIERCFAPIDVRDFYSVVGLLLCQLYSLRLKLKDDDDHYYHRNDLPFDNDVADKLNKEILELKKALREKKLKNNELYRINQQWSIDYSELKKQMEQGGCLQPSSSLMCQQCRALQMQLDEQVALLTDANATLKKMKTNEKSLIGELRNKDKLTQEIINECSALKIQLQEVGDVSAIVMLRNDKQELMQEMQKIKEKNKSLEKERANLQTQLNKFRQSVRHLLKSDSSVQSDAPSSYNYVSYHSSSHPSQNSSYGRTNDRLHASAHSAFYNVKVPPKLAISEEFVNPKHFATLQQSSNNRKLYYSASNNNYKQPSTPPGLLSRGKNTTECGEEIDPSPYPRLQPSRAQTSPHLTTQPLIHTSSQYLEPISYWDKLATSPLNVPRPLSAPGSMFSQTQFPVMTDSAPNSPFGSNTDLSALDHMTMDHTHTMNGFHNDVKRPTRLDLSVNKQPLQHQLHHHSDSGCHDNETPHITVFEGNSTHYPNHHPPSPRKPESHDSTINNHTSICNA